MVSTLKYGLRGRPEECCMFDAKSLIEMMMRGAAPQAPAQGGQGGGLGPLADILGGLMKQGGPGAGGGLADVLGKMMQQGGAAPQPNAAPGQGPGGGLGDILGRLGSGPQAGAGASQPQAAPAGGAGAGLDDILRQLQEKLGGAQGGQGGQGGGLMDVLGQILGQATQGVKEGAQRIDDATGASRGMKQATGQSPEDLLAQLKDLIAKNQLGAGAAAGGLGALVLGTRTGRALAGQAIKLGGLALIGGLAYKALQNYQAGRPLISGPSQIAPAPSGSGFEPNAVSHDAATAYVRAMIAAAAADGRIDADEQRRIFGGLKQAGLDAQAEEFLANELNNPASPAELAALISTEQEAVQLYTAARVAIEDEAEEEHQFLVELAGALGIDEQLAQHIDATARAAA
jgi:uncharacterized membrane protein YebE (DUF533 family)